LGCAGQEAVFTIAIKSLIFFRFTVFKLLRNPLLFPSPPLSFLPFFPLFSPLFPFLSLPVYFQLWTAILLWTDCSIQQIRPVSDLQLYFGLHLRHRSDSIAPERTKDSNLTSTGKRTVSIFGVGVLRCAIPRCSKQVGFVDSRCCDVGFWSARPVPTHSTMMFLTQPPTISLTEETSCQCSPLVSVQWNAHSSGTL
jgi:hypothetical protein